MFSFKTERVWHVTKWYVCKLRSFIQNYGAHRPYPPCGVEKVQTRLPRYQRRAGVWDMETLGSTGHTLKRRNRFRDPGCLIMQALSWVLLSLSLTLYGGRHQGLHQGVLPQNSHCANFLWRYQVFINISRTVGRGRGAEASLYSHQLNFIK